MDNSTGNSTQATTNGPNLLIVFIDSTLLLLSLSGNSLVIYTIYKERKLHTTCNYLLLNLAICDLIVVTLGTSTDIMLQYTYSKWILGLALCRTISPAMTMFFISGSFILVIISLDRYKMFVHPLKARYQRKHVKYAVIVVHSISFICVAPFAYFSTIKDGHCYDVWPTLIYRKGYTVFLFVMQYALPLLIMGIAYIGIALSLMRNNSAFKKNFHIGHRAKRETSANSLIGAVSLQSQYNCKTDVNISMAEQYGMTRGIQSTVDDNDGLVSCASVTHKLDTVDEEISVTKWEYPKKVVINGGKANSGKRAFPFWKKDVSNDKHLINDHNTEPNGPSSTIEVQLKQPDNNNESQVNKNLLTLSSQKRRLSDRLPLYRRNAIRRRPSPSISGSSLTPSKRDKRNNRALKMILLVVVVFAVFMLPNQIMSLVIDFGGKATREKYRIYAWFVMCTYFGSCTLNPFIYGLVDRTYRAGFKKIVKKIAGLCTCLSNQN